MNYNVDYFIRKFEAIPEEMWCIGNFQKEEKKCALGFCETFNSVFLSPEGKALGAVLQKLKVTVNKYVTRYDNNDQYFYTIYYINDNHTEEYDQPTPKQRILAALYDIKKLQQPKYEDITKQIAELPIQNDVPDLKLKLC